MRILYLVQIDFFMPLGFLKLTGFMCGTQIWRGGVAAAGSHLAAEMGKGKKKLVWSGAGLIKGEWNSVQNVQTSGLKPGDRCHFNCPHRGGISWSTTVWRNFNPTGLAGCTSSISHQWGWRLLMCEITSSVKIILAGASGFKPQSATVGC